MLRGPAPIPGNGQAPNGWLNDRCERVIFSAECLVGKTRKKHSDGLCRSVSVATVERGLFSDRRWPRANAGGMLAMASVCERFMRAWKMRAIRREALQKTPLAFTKENVVGQGRFAAAGHAADQRQLFEGDAQRDGLEVVFAAAVTVMKSGVSASCCHSSVSSFAFSLSAVVKNP